MKNALVLILADWLAHPTYGVNALLAAVPLDTGETRAASVTLFDEVRDPVTARAQAPSTLPALQIVTPTGETQDGAVVQPFPADGRIELAVKHTLKLSDASIAAQHMEQVNRATQRSIRLLFSLPAGETARQRIGVQWYETSQWRSDDYATNDDNHHARGLIMQTRARDLWTATGAI